ncbi:MAG TPA: DeoR family transcriptional regulator [Anaerolineales bacterium]|nr:DeoR family transcriptional regulator [Anaerolineales bacterium]
MTQRPSLREKAILTEVRRRGVVSIQALAERLEVSLMTIHRDLNKLVSEGSVEKARGEVRLPKRPIDAEEGCLMCGKPVPVRTAFVIRRDNGEQHRACCAHCGLMALMMAKEPGQAMATDFLFGHIVSATQAHYVIGSTVNVCCVPSVLSFSSRDDARRFTRGYGGRALGYAETLEHLKSLIHASMPHHGEGRGVD